MEGSAPPPPPLPPAAVALKSAGDEVDGNRYVRRPQSDPRPVRLVALHRQQPPHRHSMEEQVKRLLAEKWPKTDQVRDGQLARSCDALPLSLVLLMTVKEEEETEAVVGHAMLLRCVEDAKGVIAESVLVAEHLRGMGYGGHLMRLMHEHAVNLGFETVYLSTRDKRDFYQHLGYELCEAVSPHSAASSRVDRDALERLKGAFGGGGAQSQYVWLRKCLH